MVSRGRPHGKGANVTAACEAMLSAPDTPAPSSCSATATSARQRHGCRPLVDAVEGGECDLAIAAFARRVGGGLGLARRLRAPGDQRACGFRAARRRSPASARCGAEVLRAVLPFAAGFGMEIGMTVDAVRAGHRVREIELDLAHRATGRTLGGFVHRGRQLRDIARAYAARRRAGRRG